MRSYLLLLISVLATGCASGPAATRKTASPGPGLYPLKPIEELTPGAFCERPNHQFKGGGVCNRAVSRGLKQEVMSDYNSHFGNFINDRNRDDFKIDHFIPLCLGGANERKNLWPQHKRLYEITDPFEEFLCVNVRQGKMSREKAIDFIKAVKNDTSSAQRIWREIHSFEAGQRELDE